MTRADEPAFPMKEVRRSGVYVGGEPILTEDIREGLTKREYFAGLAMQGLCTQPSSEFSTPEELAKYAVKAADALIKELERGR